MELYVSPEIANEIIEISKSFQVHAQVIGNVKASTSKKLTIKSQFGTFNYF